MLLQLKSGNNKFKVPSSAPVVSNRKSESHQKSVPPSIPRRCAISRENLGSTSSGLKRMQGHDLSESNANEERMRKKHKVTMEAEKSQVHKDSDVFKKKRLTGHSFKSKFKRPQEAIVPEKMATDKSEKLVNPIGVEEGMHSASSTKKQRLTKKYEHCYEDSNDSERDVLLDEDKGIDNEKCDVDGGRLPVVSSSLNNAKDTIEENSEEHFGDQDHTPSQKKLAVEGNSSESGPIILLKKLKKLCAMRWNALMEKHKKEIQEIQQVWEDDISEMETDKKLEAAFIRVVHGKSSKVVDKMYLLDDKSKKKRAEITLQRDIKLRDLDARQQAEKNEENQKVHGWLADASAPRKSQSELRAHMVGAKDVKPLIEHHGVNNYSSTIVQGKHILQSSNSGCATVERLACLLTNGIPSSASNSIKKEIVQSFELIGDVSADFPETVANEIVDDAKVVDLSTSTPIKGSGEGDAIDLPVAEQLTKPKPFGNAERIFANPPASGERINSELQLLELHKYIPAESAETVDIEFVDDVNPVELSDNTSTEGFGKEGTSHLPDGTIIDDLDLVGQVLQTSDQTKASQHPSPLPLRIQEDEDVVSAELQGHVVEVVGKANSSLSKVIAPELVGTATNSLSNIEPQSPEDPELETLSSSRTEVSTSKIIDTVIVEQSSTKLQDQETSIVKDQVTSLIELVDSERVDTAAPVATSELVVTAKSLQSDKELQNEVEPAIETQSAPSVEVAVSENLNRTLPAQSSTEQQDEDALIVENQLSVEIEVSNIVVADNATSLQSHIDAPSIESGEQLQFMPIETFPSCNQLPHPELEMLSHTCTAELIEDLQRLTGVGPETQSLPNNVAAEGMLSTTGIPHRQLRDASHVPSHEAAAWISTFMHVDPFQSELEKISKGIKELQKSHEDTVSALKSGCVKEMEELIAKVKNKYQIRYENARAQFGQKSNELNQNLKKLMMNKKLADAFKLKGLRSNPTQHQHPVRPTGATPLNPQITGLNGQGVQQMLVTPSTRVGPLASRPLTSQSYAATSVQAAGAQAQHAAAIYRQFGAVNGVHPSNNMCIPRSGENIHSLSTCIQSYVAPAAPSIPSASLISAFQISQQQQLLQQQQWQQQQQQLELQQQYLASQWPSSIQNPRRLGYSSTLSHAYQSGLGLQQHHNQLPSYVQGGNQRSCGGAATTAINLCNDD